MLYTTMGSTMVFVCVCVCVCGGGEEQSSYNLTFKRFKAILTDRFRAFKRIYFLNTFNFYVT
jgi:hypothetical protein